MASSGKPIYGYNTLDSSGDFKVMMACNSCSTYY